MLIFRPAVNMRGAKAMRDIGAERQRSGLTGERKMSARDLLG